MLFLSAADLRTALTMPVAIDAMKSAFLEISSGTAVAPTRMNLPLPGKGDSALVMPCLLGESKRFGIKSVTINRGNPESGLPLIRALMLLQDPESGEPLALMDGGTLTAIRTGAASGLATDLFARGDASVLAIFGSGVQARTQVEAVLAVRSIRKVLVFARNPDHAARLCDEIREAHGVEASTSADQDDLRSVDVICTATMSTAPLFQDDFVPDHCHINAIGAYTPEMVEVPPATVAQSFLVVDHVESSLHEAGDLLQAVEKGFLPKDAIASELGHFVGKEIDAATRDRLTLFKSVGNAAQDVAAASRALERALVLGVGTTLAL